MEWRSLSGKRLTVCSCLCDSWSVGNRSPSPAGIRPVIGLPAMTIINKRTAVFLLIAAGALIAQTPAITRTVVTRKDVSVPGREAVDARVEIIPGGFAGRHTHPGDEISYILEGEGEILMEGQPPLKVKAGDG